MPCGSLLSYFLFVFFEKGESVKQVARAHGLSHNSLIFKVLFSLVSQASTRSLREADLEEFWRRKRSRENNNGFWNRFKDRHLLILEWILVQCGMSFQCVLPWGRPGCDLAPKTLFVEFGMDVGTMWDGVQWLCKDCSCD